MILQREDYPTPADFYYPASLNQHGYFVTRCLVEFPEHEFQSLTFDDKLAKMSWPDTEGFGLHFASIASADGELDVRPFGNATHRRGEKNGIWTANAGLCPSIVRWVKSLQLNYGTVRILRKSNSVRDLRDIEAARALYHRDTTNLYNEQGSGWILRMIVQLTDNPRSMLMVRSERDDASSEQQIPLHRGTCIIFDADRLWHTVWHPEDSVRYALVMSFESSPQVDEWQRQPFLDGAV